MTFLFIKKLESLAVELLIKVQSYSVVWFCFVFASYAFLAVCIRTVKLRVLAGEKLVIALASETFQKCVCVYFLML